MTNSCFSLGSGFLVASCAQTTWQMQSITTSFLMYRSLLRSISPQKSRSYLSCDLLVGMIPKAVFRFLILSLTLIALSIVASAQTLAERLGYPAGTKLIIVHADDLAETHAVNAAATKAMEAGTINSASIMVACPWFPEMADYAKSHPDADFGLHLTMTSERVYYRWGPVAAKDKVPSLLDE